VYPVTERNTLVEALSSMSKHARRQSARAFLKGLSTDELQYIAAYFGARTLDPKLGNQTATRSNRACEIQRYERARGRKVVHTSAQGGTRTATKLASAVSHRMMVLLEFLTVSERTALSAKSWPATAGSA